MVRRSEFGDRPSITYLYSPFTVDSSGCSRTNPLRSTQRASDVNSLRSPNRSKACFVQVMVLWWSFEILLMASVA